MFAPTPSPQGNGNQSNQERKKERCPHGYRGPVVGEKINTVHKIEMFKKIWIDEIMSRIIRCWILYAMKMMKIVEDYWLEKFLNSKILWKFVVFIFCLCKYFLHNLVKYCSIFKILDNFQQPTKRAVGKCPGWKSSVHHELSNCKIKSVKSFAGHPVFNTFMDFSFVGF